MTYLQNLDDSIIFSDKVNINQINFISYLGHYFLLAIKFINNLNTSKSNKMSEQYFKWMKLYNKLLCSKLNFKFIDFIDNKYMCCYYENNNKKLLSNIKYLAFNQNPKIISLYNEFRNDSFLFNTIFDDKSSNNTNINLLFKVQNTFNYIQEYLTLTDVFKLRLVNKQYLIYTTLPIKLGRLNLNNLWHFDEVNLTNRIIYLIKNQWNINNLHSITAGHELFIHLNLHNNNQIFESLDINLYNNNNNKLVWKNTKKLVFRQAYYYNSTIYLYKNQIISLINSEYCTFNLINANKEKIEITLILKFSSNINLIYDKNLVSINILYCQIKSKKDTNTIGLLNNENIH